MAKRLWVKKAVGRKGALHRKLGVPSGKKIPTARENFQDEEDEYMSIS